jgi:hypothetical protein
VIAAGATGVVSTAAVDVGMQPAATIAIVAVAMQNAECKMQNARIGPDDSIRLRRAFRAHDP